MDKASQPTQDKEGTAKDAGKGWVPGGTRHAPGWSRDNIPTNEIPGNGSGVEEF